MRRLFLVSFLLAGVTSSASAGVVITTPDNVPTDLAADIQRLNTDLFATGITNIQSLEFREKLVDVKLQIARKLMGRGFDVWSNRVMQARCVEFADANIFQDQIPPKGYTPYNLAQFDRVESLSEYYGSRSSGGSLSLAYDIFSLGGSNEKTSGNYFRRENRYIDVALRYAGTTYRAFDGKPSDTALKRLENEGLEGFAKICGQAYIDGVGFGVSLDGQVSFEISINQDTAKNKAGVDVGIGKILSFSFDTKSEVSTLSQISQVKMTLEGGNAQFKSPADFLDAAHSFNEDNAAAFSSFPVGYNTTPYSQLGWQAFKDFVPLAEVAAGTAQSLAWKTMQARQNYADVTVGLNNPTFYSPTVPELQAKEKELAAFLDRVSTAVSVCKATMSGPTVKDCVAAAAQVGDLPIIPELQLK
jgi:hypothetical protein